ncbi:MAG: sigma-70 family RNA polymerase sigma factor [Acidobacteriota bacterium]|nr:sigma-70 family RNA polymerase sigma factor [Acidobacteriota bacterium]
MGSAAPSDITRLLAGWGRGDRSALEQLTPLVYAELRRIAARQLRREEQGHTLQPTALVNEAFVRLCGSGPSTWQDRAHFFGVCAQVMRHILTDHARAQLRAKRGAGVRHVPLDAAATVAQEQTVDHAALDDALRALESVDPRKGRIVELRYFAGLGIEETAEAMNISAMTVRREWTRAKAWLYRELAAGGSR